MKTRAVVTKARGLAVLTAFFVLGLVTGCDDKDTVPKVDDVSNIVVGGEHLTPRQFLDKFCIKRTDHPTCAAVALQSQKDSLKRKPTVSF
jgi:hypothetical protein